MRIVSLQPPPRVAVLTSPSTAWRLPQRWPGLDACVVVAGAAGWADAVDRALAHRPEVSLVLDPEPAAPFVRRLPGIRVAVVLRDRDADRCPDPSAFQWFTDPGAAGKREDRWPVLGQVAPPVDARSLPGPDLDRQRVLVPAWAAAPPDVLDALRDKVPVEMLPSGLPPAEIPSRLAAGGTYLHLGGDGAALREDPVPVLAMARGLLVVTRHPFPVGWGIEPGDDHLAWPDPEAWPRDLARLALSPGALSAIRVRGWQKARESLDSGTVLARVVIDALVRETPQRLLGAAG